MAAWARGPAVEQINQLCTVGQTASGPSRTLIGFDSNSFRECVSRYERIQQQLEVHCSRFHMYFRCHNFLTNYFQFVFHVFS